MTSVAVDVFALHGFLGAKDDWQLVSEFLHQEQPNWKLYPVDLYSDIDLIDLEGSVADLSMDEWAQLFNTWVKKKSTSSSRRILLGYSMGGRLGLHSISKDFDLWSGAVFLSTNPGLLSSDEKLNRLENDKKWADRFLNEEFYQVLSDWNAQDVFKGSLKLDRKTEVLDKKNLAQALTRWSLGHQKNFRDQIERWPLRQIWAAGEKDKKFSQLLATLPATDHIQKWVVEEASHRLLFEAPQEVAHFVVRVGSPIMV